MRAAAICFLVLLAAVAGCGRTILASDTDELGVHPIAGQGGTVVTPSEPRTGLPDDDPALPVAGASAMAPTSEPDAPLVSDAPDEPEPEAPADALPPDASEREIFVGELWSVAPLLCDPEAPWFDTALVVEPTGYVEPVALILDPGSDPAAPTGQIAFGRGRLPDDPGPDADTAGSDSGSFLLCSVQGPSKGGVYTILDAHRSAARLTFDIIPAEIWNADCDRGEVPCLSCSASACQLAGTRQSVDLVVHDDAAEGSFLIAAFGTASELRLVRSR